MSTETWVLLAVMLVSNVVIVRAFNRAVKLIGADLLLIYRTLQDIQNLPKSDEYYLRLARSGPPK